jgi:hypothetical protein
MHELDVAALSNAALAPAATFFFIPPVPCRMPGFIVFPLTAV